MKSISNVMKMQIVFLLSTCTVNQHHNTSPPLNLSQNGPQSTQTWLGQITPLSHFPHSLQINQSPSLLCALLMSILYSSIDFCHTSICLNCFLFIPPFNIFSPFHPEGGFVIGIKKVGGMKKQSSKQVAWGEWDDWRLVINSRLCFQL